MPQANLIGLQQAHERAGAMVACQNASPVRQMSSSQGRSDLEATASSTTPVRSPQARRGWLSPAVAEQVARGPSGEGRERRGGGPKSHPERGHGANQGSDGWKGGNGDKAARHIGEG
ncbi:hypothetical protein BRADI_2g55745v3 [Brachypodium distachyon]|uniref:Uncharacterized protein n=1 Tax=Brachypodium distachyon TaxID=15368 RepID=A0A2K2DG34_BRADI|nr:hypothetical protein BRADI_2g55745v3 [Brachypodium distachyon]